METRRNRRSRLVVIASPVVGAAIILAFWGRLPQDPEYHRFADTRAWDGIPNAADVLSNAVFAAAGGLGLAFLASARGRRRVPDSRIRNAYFLFFAGVFLTAFGSAYYHWAPDNGRLFWDRLPMTLAFTSLFAEVLGERVDSRLGNRLLVPLLVLGAASVLYWRWTEAAGRGDLRPYAVVQYGLIASLALLLLLFPDPHSRGLGAVAVAYVLAKAFELLDAPIFRLTGTISGHTLKHVAAGVAAGLVLAALIRRRPTEGGSNE
ncbi:MAG TPA: alkaline phytoceramidase [Thermoanaerobaculia bacterium]